MPEDEEEEHIFTVPLSKCKNLPRTKRARVAMSTVRSYIASHMKVPEKDVWVDASVNDSIWSRGISKPPSRIRVKAIKFEDGLVEVSTLEG
ncbi:MAG: 50S ribosomal protein L31e [Methanomassiliicoccales archaeon]|nr:MAG: 50S ribosomal protein L31e [Methanomassiliicoccales archaeon]